MCACVCVDQVVPSFKDKQIYLKRRDRAAETWFLFFTFIGQKKKKQAYVWTCYNCQALDDSCVIKMYF